MNDDLKNAIATIIAVIILLITAPFLNFLIGWFMGWLIQITFSNMFINGLALLNITITVNQIPLLCGILSVIGSFFRSSVRRN